MRETLLATQEKEICTYIHDNILVYVLRKEHFLTMRVINQAIFAFPLLSFCQASLSRTDQHTMKDYFRFFFKQSDDSEHAMRHSFFRLAYRVDTN